MDTELIEEVQNRPVQLDYSSEDYRNESKRADAWMDVRRAALEKHTTKSEGERKIIGIVYKMDTEQLIEEVRSRPALWDYSSEDYKDKRKRADAWMDVCCTLVEDFDTKSEAEKKITVTEVMGKWRSVRDNYIRWLKKFNQAIMSGAETIPGTMYIYHEHLAFLNPDIEYKNIEYPVPSKKRRKRSSVNNTVGSQLVSCLDSFRTTERPIPTPSPSPSPICIEDEDLNFFKSLLPTVKRLSPSDKMDFRIQTMQLLQQY